MTDRELLEFAAKAIGGRLVWSADQCFLFDSDECTSGVWRPLDDDADAFRLMVDAKIDVHRYETQVNGDATGIAQQWEPLGDSPYSATRRAIVRAAAEIGRSQP